MSSSASTPDVSNVSNASIQTDLTSNYDKSTYEYAPNTRFAIVSHYDDGNYTLMETGSIDEYKEKIRDFIMREFQSEYDTVKYDPNDLCGPHINYKLRVYSFTDEEPFDINTSDIIFSTNNTINMTSLNLPREWELMGYRQGQCVKHKYTHKNSGCEICVVIWLR